MTVSTWMSDRVLCVCLYTSPRKADQLLAACRRCITHIVRNRSNALKSPGGRTWVQSSSRGNPLGITGAGTTNDLVSQDSWNRGLGFLTGITHYSPNASLRSAFSIQKKSSIFLKILFSILKRPFFSKKKFMHKLLRMLESETLGGISPLV
jgi:hypothetical protein